MSLPKRAYGPLEGSGVTLYVQLAGQWRSRIVRGTWAVGDQMPTVAQLAEEHGVAAITVRQALKLLVNEGLITSARGRGTFVTGVPAGPSAGLRAAINDPMVVQKGFRIRVLSKQRLPALPDNLRGNGSQADEYVLLKKVHFQDGEPFGVMNVYVAADLFDRFPPRSEQVRKLDGLLIESCPDALGIFHTAVHVVSADVELAHRLTYAFGAPVAHLVRLVCDLRGRVVYAGEYWYRGDRFVLDVKTSGSDVSASFFGAAALGSPD